MFYHMEYIWQTLTDFDKFDIFSQSSCGRANDADICIQSIYHQFWGKIKAIKEKENWDGVWCDFDLHSSCLLSFGSLLPLHCQSYISWNQLGGHDESDPKFDGQKKLNFKITLLNHQSSIKKSKHMFLHRVEHRPSTTEWVYWTRNNSIEAYFPQLGINRHGSCSMRQSVLPSLIPPDHVPSSVLIIYLQNFQNWAPKLETFFTEPRSWWRIKVCHSWRTGTVRLVSNLPWF